MIVVRHKNNDPTQVTVWVKGAPDYVIPLCNRTHDFDMNETEFVGQDQNSSDDNE
jgi:hypothetical protein